jgi:hypothetical protein
MGNLTKKAKTSDKLSQKLISLDLEKGATKSKEKPVDQTKKILKRKGKDAASV